MSIKKRSTVQNTYEPIERKKIALAINHFSSRALQILDGVRACCMMPAMSRDHTLSEGFNWSFCGVPERRNPSLAWLKDFDGDGAIVSITSKEDLEIARSLPFPIVNVVNDIPGCEEIPSVFVDSYKVGQMQAEHLLRRNYKNFAWFGSGELRYAQERCAGFCDAIHEAGYDVTIWTTDQSRTPSELESPATFAKVLRAMPMPLGIACATDQRAVGIMDACQMNHVLVPQDVAVVGAGDEKHITVSPLAKVFISSVSYNDIDLGRMVATLLNNLITDPDSVKHPLILLPPLRVIPRNSTEIPGTRDVEVLELIEWMRANLSRRFKISELSEQANLTRRALEIRFRNACGESPYQVALRLRLERAQQFYEQENPPSEAWIAKACGFTNVRGYHLRRDLMKRRADIAAGLEQPPKRKVGRPRKNEFKFSEADL